MPTLVPPNNLHQPLSPLRVPYSSCPYPQVVPTLVTSNYMQHLDLARWQRHSLNFIIDDLATVLLSCLDFAETASDNATQRFYADYSRGHGKGDIDP